MKKPTKTLPHFATETEERAFWEAQDSSDYVDWTQAHSVVLPNLSDGRCRFVMLTDKRWDAVNKALK